MPPSADAPPAPECGFPGGPAEFGFRGDDAETDLVGDMNASVLAALRPLAVWFSVLMAFFAVLDLYLLPPERAATVAATAWATAAAIGALAVWLTVSPPPSRWANPLGIAVGLLGLLRTALYLLALPEPFQVHQLAILIVGAGCVLLSRAWWAGYVGACLAVWFGVALSLPPAAAWLKTVPIVLSMLAVSAVVLAVRRRSFLASARARRLDAELREELAQRVRVGDLLTDFSTRLLHPADAEFDAAVADALRGLASLNQVADVRLARFDAEGGAVTTTHRWPADPQLPPDDIVVTPYLERLRDGETVLVRDAAFSSAAAGDRPLRSLLAVPLPRREEGVPGFLMLSDVRPRAWSAGQSNLLRLMGDVLTSAVERRRAEERRRLGDARFRRLFDANIVGVFFADLRGAVHDANQAFLSMLGRTAAELPLRWDDLTPPEWWDHDGRAVARLLRDGVDPPWEKEFFDRDGRRVPALIGGALLSPEPPALEADECVVFVLDLTESKRAEREIETLHAGLERAGRLGTMGEMAAGVAHEVHQPLGVIANYAQAARERLARGNLTPEQTDRLMADIAAECERAAGVIRHIRDFVGHRAPERRPVDLNAAVGECLRLARFEVRNAEAVAATDLASDLPPALTDAPQLTQMLLNLVLNAVQAMAASPQPRRLRLATRRDGRFVELRVSDTGPGVADEDRPRLFDQFFTTKPQGLGLGLSLSRSIAAAHGGTLELAASGPQGATFVLRLPIAVGR